MLGKIGRLYRDAFSGLPRAAWLISFAMLVNRMGTMVVPFLALYLTRIGMTFEEVGWLLGVSGLGGIAGSYLGGKLCDHFSASRVQIASLVGSGCLLLVLAQVESRWGLYLGFFLFFLIGDVFRPASAVAIQTAVPPEARLQAAGLRRLAINLGVSVAPVVGGMLALFGYSWLFWIDGLTSLAAAWVLWRWVPTGGGAFRPAAAAALGQVGAGSPWRDGFFLLSQLATFGCAVAFMQVNATLTLTFANDYHLREDDIGLLLAINPVLIVFFEMVLVRSLRPFPALPILGVGTVCIGIGLGLLALGNSFWWAFVPILLFTLGEMLTFPTAEAWVSSRAADHRRGAYLGVYSMCFGLSNAVAPIVGLKAYALGGMPLLWGGVAVVGTVSGLMFFILRQFEKRAATLVT